MPDSHHAAKPTLSFAKLVATPTELAWSQAYNAGNLFVCFSLVADAHTEGVSLHAIGKDIFNLLQSEFFSIEDKTSQTIKEAIKVSTTNLPEGIDLSLILANFKDNALTIFIAGSGKVIMKRNEKIGVLLERHGQYSEEEITYASGFLENGDTIVMQTGQFAQGVTPEVVQEALELELPNDVVEALSPQVHEQDNGAQAAIVIRSSGFAQQTPHETEPLEENIEDVPIAPTTIIHKSHSEEETFEEPIEDGEPPKKSFAFQLPSLPHPSFQLAHKRKLYLSIAIILVILLGASVFLTVKKQGDEQRQAIFKEVYTSALRDYEEGQGIETLNPEGSRESYLKAESTLKEGETKIAQGTEEYMQLEELLTKVTAALQNKSQEETSVSIKEATAPENSLIAIAKGNPTAKGFGQNTTTVYMITSEAITAISKSRGSKQSLIENESAWSSPQAVVPYQTNVYVLDQKNSVIKYVSATDGFGKASYFTGTKPDLSQATGMAIDGSVWIVTKTGKILKYTKGEQDTFGISGMSKPLNNPTKIVTDSTMDSIYVLDNGNKRIVQIDKKGAFKKEYPAGVITTATEFELDQKNNKFLILSGGKVWELPL